MYSAHRVRKACTEGGNGGYSEVIPHALIAPPLGPPLMSIGHLAHPMNWVGGMYNSTSRLKADSPDCSK